MVNFRECNHYFNDCWFFSLDFLSISCCIFTLFLASFNWPTWGISSSDSKLRYWWLYNSSPVFGFLCNTHDVKQYHLTLHSSLMGILKYTYSCSTYSCSRWTEFMVWVTLDKDRGSWPWYTFKELFLGNALLHVWVHLVVIPLLCLF